MIDEGKNIVRKLNNAKDIKNIFRRLRKKGYKIKTNKGIVGNTQTWNKTTIKNPETGIWVIVIWRDVSNHPGGFKQEILKTIY